MRTRPVIGTGCWRTTRSGRYIAADGWKTHIRCAAATRPAWRASYAHHEISWRDDPGCRSGARDGELPRVEVRRERVRRGSAAIRQRDVAIGAHEVHSVRPQAVPAHRSLPREHVQRQSSLLADDPDLGRGLAVHAHLPVDRTVPSTSSGRQRLAQSAREARPGP